MRRVAAFIKREPVLTAAWVLAAASAFLVKPNIGYLSYIDWRSLCILWSLMAIMQGFRENGVFAVIGHRLLKKTDTVRELAAILVALCFFGSMLMTNDVALIAFVPFAILILQSCGREDVLIPVVVLQTVAANMGSMLTPVGSPQNLYIYAASGFSVGRFIMIMLPYSAAAAALLAVGVLILKGGRERADADAGQDPKISSKRNVVIYAALFCAALLTVARILPFYVSTALVLIVVLIIQRKLLLRVDYSLLLIGFFIFTGNMGNIPAVKEFLTGAVAGRVKILAVLMSQVISNVPATLLLSEFTGDYRSLLVGVDIGGLGTLIASMASLISYKFYARVQGAHRGRYLLCFTLVCLVFLAVLLPLSMLI